MRSLHGRQLVSGSFRVGRWEQAHRAARLHGNRGGDDEAPLAAPFGAAMDHAMDHAEDHVAAAAASPPLLAVASSSSALQSMHIKRALDLAASFPQAELNRVSQWAADMQAAAAQCGDWRPSEADTDGVAARQLTAACAALARAWLEATCSPAVLSASLEAALAAGKVTPPAQAMVRIVQRHMHAAGWRVGCAMQRVFVFAPCGPEEPTVASVCDAGFAVDGAAAAAASPPVHLRRTPVPLPDLVTAVVDRASPYLRSALRREGEALLAQVCQELATAHGTLWVQVDLARVQFGSDCCVVYGPAGELTVEGVEESTAVSAAAVTTTITIPRAWVTSSSIPPALRGEGRSGPDVARDMHDAMGRLFAGTSAEAALATALAWCGAALQLPTTRALAPIAWLRLCVLTQADTARGFHPLSWLLMTFAHHAVVSMSECGGAAPSGAACASASSTLAVLVVRVAGAELDARATAQGKAAVVQWLLWLLRSGVAVCVDVAPGHPVPALLQDTEALRLSAIRIHADSGLRRATATAAEPYVLHAAAKALRQLGREDRLATTLLRTDRAAAAMRLGGTNNPACLLAELLQAQRSLRLRLGAVATFEQVHGVLHAYAALRGCAHIAADLLPQHVCHASEVLLTAFHDSAGTGTLAATIVYEPAAAGSAAGGVFRNVEVLG